MLRQVTQPPHIAGPLALTCGRPNIINLNKKNMKKIAIKICLLSICTFLFSLDNCFSQETIQIDLNNFTFNNLQLNELTIDKVTDLLGRPSATNNSPIAPELVDITGAIIHYHDKGLTFWFAPTKTDQLKHLWNVKVYLVRSWDKDFNEFFYPFKGKLEPDLNGNMKMDSICSIFKDFNPKITSAERSRQTADSVRKANKLERYIRPSTISHDRISIKTEAGSISLDCEELTKFLETFTLFPSGYIK